MRRTLRRSRWHQGLLLTAVSAALLTPPVWADAALERLQLADGVVLLNGVGVAKQLNEELYVVTLYATRPSREPLELLDARQRRRLHVRIVADRMYPSGVARHFRDLVSLNNPRDELGREAKNLNRFYGLFQQGLMRGDELVLDNVPGKGLVVSINGQKVADFSSPMLFDLLLRCFIGDKPPTLQFRSALLGDQDSASRAATLARFAALQPQEERLLIYANVKLPERDTTEPAASEPARPEPSKVDVAKAEPSKTEPVKAEPAVSKTETSKAADSKPPAKTESVASNKPTDKPVEKPLERPVEKPAGKPPTTLADNGIAPGAATAPVQAPPQKQLSADEITALLQRYESQLRDRLLAGLEYPRREMKRKYGITQMARQKGKVVLRLHLDIGGDINAAWLQERTNEPILDNTALALVDKLAPFPPLPKELPESAYEFYVTLEFDPDR
ncbi:MAG TPA: TonB family protein [Permianibacter sp.]|nr:TonB family protein [Permianibacter sp.]